MMNRKYIRRQPGLASLASDYTYAQCLDPQGCYWHPATGAASKAEQNKYKE